MYCRELLDTGWPIESSRSAKLIVGGVNCSGQIISLRRFDKKSDEIKPHNVQNLTYKEQEIPQQSLSLEYQPSFIVRLLFITVLQSRGTCFREQSKFFKSDNLFVISILTSCQFTNEKETWNIKGRFPESWSLRASVSSSPLPSPFHFLFCSRSNVRAITRLETLATQDRD